PDGGNIACGAGCSHCCSLHVGASVPEIALLAGWLRESLSEDEMRDLLERIAAVDAITRGLDTMSRARTKISCPLLVNNECSVYDARPLGCRGWNSDSAAACERSRQEPGLPISVNQELLGTCDEIAVGIHTGLTMNGLRPETFELVSALKI